MAGAASSRKPSRSASTAHCTPSIAANCATIAAVADTAVSIGASRGVTTGGSTLFGAAGGTSTFRLVMTGDGAGATGAGAGVTTGIGAGSTGMGDGGTCT